VQGRENFVGGMKSAKAVGTAIAGITVVAIGFIVGGAVSDAGDSPSSYGQSPTPIATRDRAVDVPTLGTAKRIPPLAAEEQTGEIAEEGTATTSTPSSSSEEAVPQTAEPESSAPAPEKTPSPEVTVAPSG
jgi:hypothetical protein